MENVKPGAWAYLVVGGANIQIVHYFDHAYLEEEKSMIHSFTVTFGAKYLSLVFLPTKLSVLLKIIFFISLRTTKITSKIHVGHVTYSFINMLFISAGIFVYHSINNTIP